MRKVLIGLTVAASFSVMPSYADWGNVDNINKNWQKIDEKVKANEDFWHKKVPEFQKTSPLQLPGVFQSVGEFRKALSEGKVIKVEPAPCHRRFLVGSDTLFNFDEATLTPYAEETLRTLAPMIVKLGSHPVRVEGHTDSEGTDQYNQGLSEKRAARVKNWLIQNHYLASSAVEMAGFGESRPKEPNKKPDGTDNPLGRAANRRVEIIVDTCTKLDAPATATTPGGEGTVAASGNSADQSANDNSDGEAAAGTSDGNQTDGSQLASASGTGGNTSPGSEHKPLSTVDLSELLPYSNLFSSEEIKSGFSRIHVRKPFGDTQLAVAVSAPNDFEEKPVELTKDELARDKLVQIPLVVMNPKGNTDVHLEVRYIRASEDTNLNGFIRTYAQDSGLELVGRRPGEFNGRQVEDALLKTNDKSKGSSTVTRLTASRHGDRIFLVASTCPEKDYSKWKKVFGFAAVSFAPGEGAE